MPHAAGLRQHWLWVIATALCGPALAVGAAPTKLQTVCTITINSADEKDALQRHLPASKVRFVELVERNRPDWLASACQAGVQCDVLVISGHYDGGNEFFSDQLESREFLPVDELERASCSQACPGLFAQLKEVHLFGCNTLNPQAHSSASAETVRSLVREGHSVRDALRQQQALNAGHGESSRDRMRQVFKDVPVIYGFKSVAPLGPIAAATLGNFLRSGGAREIGQGRASPRLLGHFAPYGMSVAQGMTDADPHAAVRADVCRFADDRLPAADKLDFMHQVLQRPMAQARVHLERIQRQATALDAPAQRTPAVTAALAAIAGDAPTRARFLDFARDADEPAVRTRMLEVARGLDWLTPDQHLHELARLFGELQARPTLGVTEVDLACSLNQDHALDGALNPRSQSGGQTGSQLSNHTGNQPGSLVDDLPHAALRACLGSASAHLRTLQGLVSTDPAEVKIAQAYLRHRPLTDAAELQRLTDRIAAMAPSPTQVQALETLGRHYVSDRGILDQLMRMFSQTPSPSVQVAIAGVLLRADLGSTASAPLVRTLQADRRPSPQSPNMIDALIRRLQSP